MQCQQCEFANQIDSTPHTPSKSHSKLLQISRNQESHLPIYPADDLHVLGWSQSSLPLWLPFGAFGRIQMQKDSQYFSCGGLHVPLQLIGHGFNCFVSLIGKPVCLHLRVEFVVLLAAMQQLALNNLHIGLVSNK